MGGKKGSGPWQAFGADDPEYVRWNRNVARGAQSTADNYRRKLGNFLVWAKVSPGQYAALPSREQHKLLTDYIDHEIQRKVSGGTLSTVKKATASWLDWNDRELKKVKMPKEAKRRPRAGRATIPPTDGLRRIFNAADARGRAAAGAIAHGGLRPEILGNYDGTDGLRFRDLEDARIKDGHLVFTKIPCKVNIPESLSKTDLPWFTFFGAEECSYVEAYARERVEGGEKLTLESSVIRPRKVDKPFMRTTNISDIIRRPIRAAGIDAYPYLLRSYFDTNLMLAESKGLIIRDYRQFFMGHAGDIEAVYTVHKVLPAPVVEEMRAAYERACRFLETQSLDQTNPALESVRLMMLANGWTQADLDKIDLGSKTTDELASLLRSKSPAAVAEARKPKHRAIKPEDLDEALASGWVFHSELRDGRILLETSG